MENLTVLMDPTSSGVYLQHNRVIIQITLLVKLVAFVFLYLGDVMETLVSK